MVVVVCLFRLRGTEVQPDLFAKDRGKGRMQSCQRVEVTLMRQRHKEESQQKEQAEQGVQLGPSRPGQHPTLSVSAVIVSGLAHADALVGKV
jgi:hypothetical protein